MQILKSLTCNHSWYYCSYHWSLCPLIDTSQKLEQEAIFCHSINHPGHWKHGSKQTETRAYNLLLAYHAYQSLCTWQGQPRNILSIQSTSTLKLYFTKCKELCLFGAPTSESISLALKMRQKGNYTTFQPTMIPKYYTFSLIKARIYRIHSLLGCLK